MKACAEFYYRQIAEKISAMQYYCRKVDADQFVVVLLRLRVPSAFVQPADSTPPLISKSPLVEVWQKASASQLKRIIFFISGRIIKFSHLLGEKRTCF